MRRADVCRKTNETDVKVSINIDGKGDSSISTTCGFLNHMLVLFSSHGRFDLHIDAKGDTDVDYHHVVEDVGIALGQAFRSALGDGRGITRYGARTIPMDEALVMAVVDVSGRAALGFDLGELAQKVGDFDTELAEEFFLAFSRNVPATAHIRKLAGKNAHHIIEAAFKAFARALAEAVRADCKSDGEIPSSKGILL